MLEYVVGPILEICALLGYYAAWVSQNSSDLIDIAAEA
jgi:hypothetical protein